MVIKVQKFSFLMAFLLVVLSSRQANASDLASLLEHNPPSTQDCNTALLEESYRKAWQLLKDNTLFPERLRNWDLWEHKYDNKLKQDQDLECAINQMLAQLADQYTYFRNTSQTQSRSLSDEEQGTVSYKLLSESLGYIAIKTFASEHMACELQTALNNLHHARAYILDLRENKGGYVEQALLAFSMFVDKGEFVSIKGRQDGQDYFEQIFVNPDEIVHVVNGTTNKAFRTPNLSGDKPLVVLINNGTRSAAEMLAGALKDVRAAKLVGNKTFGKGIVQGTWYLEPCCSIKIAMARFFLPNGNCINGQGITPDIWTDFDKKESAVCLNTHKLLSLKHFFKTKTAVLSHGKLPGTLIKKSAN